MARERTEARRAGARRETQTRDFGGAVSGARTGGASSRAREACGETDGKSERPAAETPMGSTEVQPAQSEASQSAAVELVGQQSESSTFADAPQGMSAPKD
jgi:hypothetical protein